MRKTPLLALVAAGAFPAIAPAQVADTTPPSVVIKIDTKLQSVDSLIGNGLTFSIDPSEDLTFTAKATFRYKGKTYTAAKSIREGQAYNQSAGFIEQTIPHGGSTAVKIEQKLKKGKSLSVTLVLSLKDTAGNKATAKKTVKLKKRY
jgi:hypothetical protein